MLDLSELEKYARDRIRVEPGGCWRWTGTIDRRSGYAKASRRNLSVSAHRYVYLHAGGIIPVGFTLDHLCHTLDLACPGGACLHRSCVNPTHLEPVTIGENSRRGRLIAANLAQTTCSRGHPFDYTDKRGWRKCRTCNSDRQREKARAEGRPPAGKYSTSCRRGHPYTEENTYWMPNGYRSCKECGRQNLRARRAAARALKEAA